MKPNFLIIGAGKAGTTSLHRGFAQHPDVGMARTKEPKFFSHDVCYDRGWEWYESLFEGCEGRAAVGEATVHYSILGVHPDAARRIAHHLPGARIIYIVREPMSRLESMWLQYQHHGMPIPRSFGRTIRSYPEFIDSSLYFKQLSAYREHFPDERILVLFFDDLVRDPAAVFRQCFAFLGVRDDVEIEDATARHNAWQGRRMDSLPLSVVRRRAPGFDRVRDSLPRWIRGLLRRVLRVPVTHRPRWDPETRQWVLNQIRDDVAALLEHCDKPLDLWAVEA